MDLKHLIPTVEKQNEEATEIALHMNIYNTYIKWLKDNGCQYPSLEFPVAFGPYGVIGARALINIPSTKVHPKQGFLFVPSKIIISPQKARNSEIGFIFDEHPRLFKTHSRAVDYILWFYITYEFIKEEKSFYYPYFMAVGESEMLMDWSEEELNELQDKFLIFESKKQEKMALYYYESLSRIFSQYTDFFPQCTLLGPFLWAYKLVTTRSFSHGEGLVIPLADNLNHEDVYVDYLTLSTGFLEKKAHDPLINNKDYKDFQGIPNESSAPMRSRSHMNRLEKCLKIQNYAEPQFLRNIWEIEEFLGDYESSSDEEELVEDNEEDEENDEENEDEEDDEDDEECDEIEIDMADKYFVMRTGNEGGFLKGQQVFNCYGRLNNTDLLGEYGFALLPNRYDSVYVRMVKMTGANYTGEMPKIDFSQYKRLKDIVKVFYLKYYKINEQFLEYFRKIILKSPKEGFTIMGELKVITQAEQVLLELMNCYKTTIEQDEIMLAEVPRIPIRKCFALRYRISQKRIILSHLSMIETLKEIFWKVIEGQTMEAAHWKQKTIANARVMYPLRKYLRDIRLNAFNNS
ncbi:hypothetical protein SteCoe_28864 [Stentor coeruleus]|uniref:Rubisco LSMT substrate-binding domain-containing protein n=1 Tax=Stentor coeruleus TaxID=5963 RepID=A0A1R2B787_9CILI|nr:hypothetical protein SteCoe_28864 [Stentor coeruleus]